MAKRGQRNPISMHPAGSRVRPGFRRMLEYLWHTGRLQAALLALLAGWGIYDALTSPRYQIEIVEAAGAQALNDEDVADLSGVKGQPIWLVDPAEIVERVAQSPYVEHADAHLVLPNRLVVAIVERKPDVRWRHNGTTYDVTWDGLIVDGGPEPPPPAPATDALTTTDAGPVPPEGPAGITLEIVDTTPNRPLKVGDRVDADALELARRVTLRAPAELPVPITRIEWDGGLGVSLIFGENRQAVLGRSDDLDRKLATLRFLLYDSTPFTYLDLRPTTPYYR